MNATEGLAILLLLWMAISRTVHRLASVRSSGAELTRTVTL
jgi:hypothetical protein